VRNPSLIERLRSWRHGFWFGVSRRVRWRRGLHREQPARELRGLGALEAQRVSALRSGYQVQFEQRLGPRSSKINYEYLDILDRAWAHWGRGPPRGGVVCDVGCASFWYAAALHAFFRPQRLIGIEIEGHRLFRDGRARIDYAAGYVADVPGAEFVVADYAAFREPSDTITAWFPFVTATAILGWRLPLSLLRPETLFSSIKLNLKPGGLFVMVNHGPEEAELAGSYCGAAGLQPLGRWQDAGALSAYRSAPPVLSWWQPPGSEAAASRGKSA
jgi:SAM-dependent methyltransferase